MKRINLFWIIWIFLNLEFKDVLCVSYPGVYRNELPLIVPGASPIENLFVTERFGINYECIETCYPILNLCDDKCIVMPDLPECLQCQEIPAAQPTPIIIETPPYEPRPPLFQRPATPIVSYPSRLPRPLIFPKPNPPNRPIFPPSRPIIPEIPRPPVFEEFEQVPPTPILPDIQQPPEVEILEPYLPDFTSVPAPHEVENLETEMPPEVTLHDISDLNEFKPFPLELLPIPDIPPPPKLEEKIPLQPNILEIPRPPQFAIDVPILPDIPVQPILPDTSIYFEHPLIEPEFPQSIFPYVPSPPRYEDFEFPMSEVPLVVVTYEPPELPVLQPILPDTVNPVFPELPNPMSPEQATKYPENVLYQPIKYEEAGIVVDENLLQPPILNEYEDICNDYCRLKRNISECEICLKTGVPADHLELCSNCLANPSEPNCELCYPILLNLCREFCIFEENEPDCSSCYAQPLIETPPKSMEYILIEPKVICPEYCVLTPMSPECEGCGLGVEVIENVCVDICSGYCLDNPNDQQCAICYDDTANYEIIAERLPTLQVINYQCCYNGEYCTPMPRNGQCPVVCKELCTSACSNDCFNPTCPDCQEIVAMNEFRRTQFMIWLKSKLSDMRSRYMAMIEACIRRTELMYERELQAIEMEVDTSFLPA